MKETPTHTTIINLSLPLMIQQDFCKFEGWPGCALPSAHMHAALVAAELHSMQVVVMLVQWIALF
jgi:hypothetical protein